MQFRAVFLSSFSWCSYFGNRRLFPNVRILLLRTRVSVGLSANIIATETFSTVSGGDLSILHHLGGRDGSRNYLNGLLKPSEPINLATIHHQFHRRTVYVRPLPLQDTATNYPLYGSVCSACAIYLKLHVLRAGRGRRSAAVLSALRPDVTIKGAGRPATFN